MLDRIRDERLNIEVLKNPLELVLVQLDAPDISREEKLSWTAVNDSDRLGGMVDLGMYDALGRAIWAGWRCNGNGGFGLLTLTLSLGI